MAVESWKPVIDFSKLPETLEEIPDESFEVTLEEELIHIYDFQTLLKANDNNLAEYQVIYNMACKAAEQRGDVPRVAELVDIRFEARRKALEGIPIVLEVSPYTDEGSAICYGYVEGAIERLNQEMTSRERFEAQYLTTASLDGTIRTIRVS